MALHSTFSASSQSCRGQLPRNGGVAYWGPASVYTWPPALRPDPVPRVQASKYGAALIQVCQLPAYQRSGDEWRSRMQNSEKLALSYKQLFGAEETSRKKKKKTQKERRDDAASNAQQRGGHASATTEHSSQHTGEGAAVEAVAVAAEAPVEAAAGVEASEPKPKGKKKKKSKGVAPPASEGEDTAAPDAEKLEPSEGKKRKADAAVVLETVELDAKKKKSKKKKAA